MTKLCLDSDWSLTWCDLGTGSIHDEKRDEPAISCPVPGNIHMGLIKAGKMPEPLVGLNSKQWKWVEDKEWWYEKKFSLSQDDIKARTEITFDGLDLTADVWLNGVLVGSANNAFISHTFDITKAVRVGENVLTVRIDEGVNAVKDKDVEVMKKSWNNDQPYRIWMRKPQFCYGWDWTVWLATIGIWNSVTIRSYESAVLRDVFIRADFGRQDPVGAESVSLNVSTQIDGEGEYALELTFANDTRFDSEGSVTFTHAIAAGNDHFIFDFAQPKLWWPNDMGDPYLYSISCCLKDASGNVVDEKTFRYGFRKVGLDQTPINDKERSFTFLVNDRKMFSKGACWVPADCLPGRVTREKYQRLLLDAKNMHMNLMRVWGGGVYEKEAFYDYCDEYGIMVWQDFMFACAYYPDYDADFCDEIRKEAESVIKRLRNRACMFGWSGNNENYAMYLGYKRYNDDPMPFYGQKIYEELLLSVCTKYDPDRIYRFSSPYGYDSYREDDFLSGDSHTWQYSLIEGTEDFLNLWKYSVGEYKFLSEFGVLSSLNVESMEKCVSESERYPGSEEWKHHSNERDYSAKAAETFFGKQDTFDLERYTMMGQAVQAESLRYCFEQFKRNRFYCSGVLLWMYTDSYGTSGWTFVDYYLNRKALYYYASRAFAPLSAVFTGYLPNEYANMDSYLDDYRNGKVQPLDVWAVNEYLDSRKVDITIKAYRTCGDCEEVYSDSVSVETPVNGSVKAAQVDIAALAAKYDPRELAVTCVMTENGKTVSENRYFLAPLKDIRLNDAVITATFGDDTITLESDSFVWMAHIPTPDGTSLSDNDFDMLPGRKYVLSAQGYDKDTFRVLSLNPSTKVVVK